MILYFDTYITDEPLFVKPDLAAFEDKIFNSRSAYKKPAKLDIVKYTLSSYATVNWSDVLIKYELADPALNDSFDKFILDLFPDATIIHNRSANQVEYKESVKMLDGLKDDWIFYSPNNDHPIMINNIDIFDKLLIKAKQATKNHNNNFVSIYYSHFSEIINSVHKGKIYYERHYPGSRIIDEDDCSFTILRPTGDLAAIQIVHKDLLHHWFCSQDLGDARIIRSEDLGRYIVSPPQTVIVPKKEICRHFEGYSHTFFQPRRGLAYILPEQVPPVLIPDGFFEKKIRIAYGYDEYREGWVNINPLKEQYSFRDNKNGTDLMCTLDDIPLFWKDRIVETDVNPDIDHDLMRSARDKKYEIIRDPWKDLSKLKVFRYILWVRLARNIWPVIDSAKAGVKNLLKSNKMFYSFARTLLNKDF